MWKSLNPESIQTLKSLSNIEPTGIISASTNFSEGRMEEKGELDYYIGVATTKDCQSNSRNLKSQLQHGLYLKLSVYFLMHYKMCGDVFILNGSSSNYELAEGPEILWNEQKDISSPNFKSEIWIPVLKK